MLFKVLIVVSLLLNIILFIKIYKVARKIRSTNIKLLQANFEISQLNKRVLGMTDLISAYVRDIQINNHNLYMKIKELLK